MMDQCSSIPVELLAQFDIPGTLVAVEELKRGHINRTYVGTWQLATGRTRYIHQVVNHRIFPDVPGLMHNLEVVTQRLRRAFTERKSGPGETTLSIVRTVRGETFVQDETGEYWRTLEFIEDTVSYDVCPSPNAAREAAAVLGRFQRFLSDVPATSLIDTIPDFHNGLKRFEAFERAVRQGDSARINSATDEIAFARERAAIGSILIAALQSGKIPTRITHNDMKLNNVLFDSTGLRAVCLLDLDTCMGGTPLFDFGDLVRNTAVPCDEDERDLSKVRIDLELYRSICEGYLKEFGTELTARECELLPVAPQVLALTLGVRFLTDFLQGDTYFRIHRPAHNLERARTQFAVVKAMERAQSEMSAMAFDSAVAQ
jgi:Ser/Thr protein kinase RdoA (MazF antagonist)